MSSTRLISKNLSQPPLAFFTLMAIFRHHYSMNFFSILMLKDQYTGYSPQRCINYKVMSVKTKN